MYYYLNIWEQIENESTIETLPHFSHDEDTHRDYILIFSFIYLGILNDKRLYNLKYYIFKLILQK